MLEPFGQGVGEVETTLPLIALDHFFQPGLEDMDVAILEPRHDGRVLVHAHDLIAHFRQTGGGDQSNVPGTNDANVQSEILGVQSR